MVNIRTNFLIVGEGDSQRFAGRLGSPVEIFKKDLNMRNFWPILLTESSSIFNENGKSRSQPAHAAIPESAANWQQEKIGFICKILAAW